MPRAAARSPWRSKTGALIDAAPLSRSSKLAAKPGRADGGELLGQHVDVDDGVRGETGEAVPDGVLAGGGVPRQQDLPRRPRVQRHDHPHHEHPHHGVPGLGQRDDRPERAVPDVEADALTGLVAQDLQARPVTWTRSRPNVPGAAHWTRSSPIR